ncbi:MAG: CBS domain-containing protein [Candidatus Aenigmarchaeota archaeon]|nr:CBS domain-containing protein [Candidatus Aenigmarchaeota archaeon]
MDKKDILIKDVLVKNVITLNYDSPLSEALGIMKKHNFHQIPITKKKRFIGMLCLRNIITKNVDPEHTKSESLIIKTPVLNPENRIEDAVELLLNTGIKCLPVLDKNDRLEGVVSETDLIDFLTKNYSIKDITSELFTISEDQTIGKVRNMFREKNISRIPVVDKENRLVGIIRDVDLIKTMTPEKEKFYDEKIPVDKLSVKTIMTRPIVVGEEKNIRDIIPLIKKHGEVIIMQEDVPVGIITAKDILELMRFKPSKEIYVEITGLRGEEEQIKLDIDNEIKRFVQKFSRMLKNLEYLFIHVEKLRESGKRKYFDVRTRFKTPLGMFVSRAGSWDLLEAVGKALDRLEKEVKKKYDKIAEKHKI